MCSDLGINENGFRSEDPINMGNGNYIYQHQDLIIPGRGLPLTITRSYNSMDFYNGPFGSGWTFNYNMNLEVTGSGDVVVMKEDGRRDTYTLNADGTYSPPLNVFDNLTKNPDNTYTLEVKDKIEYNFTTLGKLVNITDQNGNQISFTYTGDYLTKVTDASGRELIFSYDSSGRIISITGPMGRIWSYTYDGAGNLVQYSDPTGGQFSYTYDENHWMTSIIDPRVDQIMANIFDAEGRVVSQSNALGGTYTYSYDVGNQ
ncbi:MAG: RHS repeat protein, partial [Gammaproteobacteria bacterium]|nr:RHS repeat protein [Gammaproteobacteria bacterium]